MQRTVLIGLLVLLLVPQAQAALNGDHPYEATLGYQSGLGATSGTFTLLSGAMDAKLTDVHGPYGLFQTEDAARITGLTRVCFQTTCYTSTGGQLSITIAAGGSFGVQFPKASSATAHADHVLGLLVDFGAKKDLNSFALGRTLMAPSILGSFEFTALPSIPRTNGVPDATSSHPDAGGLVGLDDKTTISVFDGTTQRATFPPGKQDPIAFQGDPAMAGIHPGLMVLPFEAGSSMHMTPADQDAADVGLDLQRISSLGQNINQASKAGVTGTFPDLNLGPLEALLPRLLNGAVLSLPITQDKGVNLAKEIGLVRFDSLDVASDGTQMTLNGAGPLTVANGHVEHASPLVGFAIFQLPWWSYILWALALFAFVARLIVKPPKENPQLDRYRWVGLVCSILLFVLFFFLWDLEVRAVWGISLLSGGAGVSAMIVAALELGPMFAVLFAVVAPLRMLLKNGVMLARGGRFMGLPGAFAYPIGFLFSAPLLLAYLNVGLQAVAGT